MTASNTRPAIPITARHGVITLFGYGISAKVERGHLLLEDGVGDERRAGRFARVNHGIRRIVVIGSDGMISLAAIRWLADQAASFVILERDGTALLTTGPVAPSDARLRRKQACVQHESHGIDIVRELIRVKLAGQETVTREKLSKPDAADRIPSGASSRTEQHKIAECLTSLDELIAAHVQKLGALKAHKKGLMQRLFPNEGELTPSLRFAEFRKAKVWAKRRVSEVLSKASIPVKVEQKALYREIGVRSHGKGIFHKEPVSGTAIGDKRVFRVVEDALVLNIVFAWEQAVATTSKAEAGMIASHRFPMFVPKSGNCDVRFMKHALLTPFGKHLLGVASPGGAGRNRTLGQEEFENLSIEVDPISWTKNRPFLDGAAG